jgi:hypothetical protein
MMQQEKLWELSVRDAETTKVVLARRADGGMTMVISAIDIQLIPSPSTADFADAIPAVTNEGDASSSMGNN